MKSLRDEIRLAAGDMDGFNFIQAGGLDFICVSRFHPCVSKDFIVLREFKFIHKTAKIIFFVVH